jgi:hypothetical protein
MFRKAVPWCPESLSQIGHGVACQVDDRFHASEVLDPVAPAAQVSAVDAVAGLMVK